MAQVRWRIAYRGLVAARGRRRRVSERVSGSARANAYSNACSEREARHCMENERGKLERITNQVCAECRSRSDLEGWFHSERHQRSRAHGQEGASHGTRRIAGIRGIGRETPNERRSTSPRLERANMNTERTGIQARGVEPKGSDSAGRFRADIETVARAEHRR